MANDRNCSRHYCRRIDDQRCCFDCPFYGDECPATCHEHPTLCGSMEKVNRERENHNDKKTLY